MRAMGMAAVAAGMLAGAAEASTVGYGYQWTSDDGAYVFDVELAPGEGFSDILNEPGLSSLMQNVGVYFALADDLQPLTVTGTTISEAGVIDGFADYIWTDDGLCIYDGRDTADFSFDLYDGLNYTLTRSWDAPTADLGQDPATCPADPFGSPSVNEFVSVDGSWVAYGGAPAVPLSPIPLPASASLLGLGLLSVLGVRRRYISSAPKTGTASPA